MASHQELDAVVSMIMVNLPFPPMPVLVRKGSGEEASCSSHDLLSRAISCFLVESWRELDATEDTQSEKRKDKMNVLMELNRDNAALHEANSIHLEAIWDLFAQSFRRYMAFYPGSPDIRILPPDSVDKNTNIHKQAVTHLKAKCINCHEECFEHIDSASYGQLITLYSHHLHLESKE